MVFSMSGFGEASVTSDEFSCTVSFRGYNSRNLDIKLKLPGQLQFQEDDQIKKLIASKISRGRIDLSVEFGDTRKSLFMMPDESVIEPLKNIVTHLEKSLGKEIPIRLSDIFAFQNHIRSETNEAIKSEQFTNALDVIDEALIKFIESKNIEGEKLVEIINGYTSSILSKIQEIEPLMPLSFEKSVERLKSNIEKLTENVALDDDPTVMREIAVIADKLDISEEVERLKIHLQKIALLFKNGGQIGKELDYLCQEMAREANTICSKSNLSEIKNHGIKIKTFVEKIREQSMNLE